MRFFQLYYGLSTCSTILATVFIVASIVTPVWETISYEKQDIIVADQQDPNVSIIFENNFLIVSRTIYQTSEADYSTQTLPYVKKSYVPLHIQAGLWKVCDTIDGKSST